MPLYEYQCSACEQVSEVLQKISDPQPTSCPACGKGPLSKLISQTNFQLKGGGWYSDAYSSKKSDTSSKKDSKSETPSSSNTDKTSAGSESTAKPESKPSSDSTPTAKPAAKTP